MKRVLFLNLLIIFCATVFGQNYTVPRDYKFVIAEDYRAFEPQMREAMDWMLETSLGQDTKKRQEATAFFMAWISGEPDIMVDIDGNILNFLDGNPELLMPFMIGWSKYALDNQYSKDKLKGNVAGIETAIVFYRKNRGYMKQNDNIEKYEKLMQKNKLEKEISKKLR